ncbi:MAG: FG-GAP repeat protein, partial [Chloroflexi bacterium]|nr:FG-GAP repeat protein [Chloroflexota bacterium]
MNTPSLALPTFRHALSLAAIVAAIAAGAFVLLQAEANLDLDSTPADYTVSGEFSNDAFGSSVVAGDINGDTIEDLIVGAFLGRPTSGGPQAGKVHVIYGTGSLPASTDLSVTNADITIHAVASLDALGAALAVGDINGDTTDDLIMGQPGLFGNGRIYVLYGGPSLPAVIDLGTSSVDVTVNGGPTAFLGSGV